MDVFAIVWVLLICLFCRIGKQETMKCDYLSIENTSRLRGILAFGIVVAHLATYSQTCEGLIGIISSEAHLIVALFFFLSGFGLVLQYKRKGKDYLKNYWKRIVYFVLIIILVSLAYWLFFAFEGDDITLASFFNSFINGSPIALNSWYMENQLCFYLFFWLIILFVDRTEVSIALVACLVVGLSIVEMQAGFSFYWVLSNLAFPLGMLWAEKKESIDRLLKDKYLLCVILSAAMFGSFMVLPHIVPLSKTVCRMLSTTSFVVLSVVGLYKIRFVGNMWSWLGSISLEIYLLQGMIWSFLRGAHIYIINDLLWGILTIVGTIAIAVPAYWVNKSIKKLIN